MKSGYKLFWSDRALNDIKKIISYLEENWTEKELINFSKHLDSRIELIISNPKLFPKTEIKEGTHKSLLTKQTVIYYYLKNDDVSIISLFGSRQNPSKLEL